MMLPQRRVCGPRCAASRSGYSIIEITVLLVVVAALAPPLYGSARELRTSFYLQRSVEEAARLFAEARWTAVAHGGATVELATEPAHGVVVTAAGDTVASARLDEGGVSVGLSRGRASARVRFGPMGLGMVSSQTLRFGLAGEERRLVISSLGRVSRR